MSEKRSTFSGSLGFVLAAAGSAVGLGNIWRFPYLAAKHGGVFLVVYIILALTFGFALLTAEISIGRKTRQSPLTAYRALKKSWGWMGFISCLIPALILTYYCIIGGWVLKYMVAFLTGHAAQSAQDGYFTGFITSMSEPIIYTVIFLGITAFFIISDSIHERFFRGCIRKKSLRRPMPSQGLYPSRNYAFHRNYDVRKDCFSRSMHRPFQIRITVMLQSAFRTGRASAFCISVILLSESGTGR